MADYFVRPLMRLCWQRTYYRVSSVDRLCVVHAASDNAPVSGDMISRVRINMLHPLTCSASIRSGVAGYNTELTQVCTEPY